MNGARREKKDVKTVVKTRADVLLQVEGSKLSERKVPSMANQRNAVSNNGEHSFLEDVLDTVDCIDCTVDHFTQKCAITHDILLAVAKMLQIVKSGVEALMEMDDNDDEDGGTPVCQKCRNLHRS